MVKYLNPDGMLKSPAFSQGILIPPSARTLIIGGQNGVGEDGKIVSTDFAAQCERAVDNVVKVVEAAGGTVANIVRLGIYVKGDVDIQPGLAAWMKHWGKRENPPVITVLRVAGLGTEADVLVEIEGLAVL